MSFEYNVHQWPAPMPSLMAAQPQSIMSVYGGYHPNGGHAPALRAATPQPLIGSGGGGGPARNATSSASSSLFMLRNGVLRNTVQAVAFGDDRLASTGDDTVAVYSTHDWRMVRTLNGRRGSRYEALAWDPKQSHQRLAILAPNDRAFRLIDVRTKTEQQLEYQFHLDGADTLTWTSDGSAMVLSSPTAIGVFDLRQSRMLITKKFDYYINSPCAYGSRVAIGTERGNVDFLDVNNLSIKASIPAHAAEVTSIAVNPVDERQIITGGNDGIVQLWEVSSYSDGIDALCASSLDKSMAKIKLLSFSGNGRYIAAYGQGEKRIDIANVATGELIAGVPNDTPVRMIAFSRGNNDQSFLAYCTEMSRDIFVHPIIPGEDGVESITPPRTKSV